MPQAVTDPFHSEAWLESPIRLQNDELQLAGALRDVPGLDPQSMRVLGSYSFIYMVNVDGYYADANGHTCDLSSGDLVLIFPELAHAYGPKPGTSWDQLYWVFNGPQFDFLRGSGLLHPSRPVWHVELVDYWHRRFYEVLAGDNWHSEVAARRIMGNFLHLAYDLAAADAEGTARQSRDHWLEEAQRLLANRSDQGWLSPERVARQVGLNYDNFRKQFADTNFVIYHKNLSHKCQTCMFTQQCVHRCQPPVLPAARWPRVRRVVQCWRSSLRLDAHL